MNRREAFLALAAGYQALAALKSTQAVAAPAAPPAAQTASAQAALALAESGLPTVSIRSVDVPVKAAVAYVPVTLSKDPICTVYVNLLTRNGQGANYAYEGGQFSRVDTQLMWKPGDPLTQYVAIPTQAGGEGKHFELIFNGTPQGAMQGSIGAITFKTAAAAQATPAAYARSPQRAPAKGALVYSFDPAGFKASDAGGPGVFRSRFNHGRTQDGNSEVGFYTDPVLHRGTKAFEIRDGILVLRAERFASPMSVRIGNLALNYGYGAAVLEANWLSQLYGYYEWDCQMPSARGTWEGLWLLPSDGTWPPEIDISESPRNGSFGPGKTTATVHWGAQASHKQLGLELDGRRIFNDPTLDFTTQFHKRAVDWRENWTTIYIDDREVARYPTSFHKPAFPLMDIAVGGWAGSPDFSSGSTEMLVRSLKVWK